MDTTMEMQEPTDLALLFLGPLRSRRLATVWVGGFSAMTTPRPSTFLESVSEELERAISLHPPLNSLHEAYAVIAEEVDELWEEVRKKAEMRDRSEIRKELVQIAAMAARASHDLGLDK